MGRHDSLRDVPSLTFFAYPLPSSMLSHRSPHPLRRLLQLSCFAALVSGCFQEVDPTMMQPACMAGTRGCECSNGLCGDELMCSPAANVCILEDCEPGTEICECDNGACGPQLECRESICRPEQGGSGTGPTMTSSTTGGPTTATMTGPTSLTSQDTDSTTSSTTNLDTTTNSTVTASDSTESTDTGNPVSCSEMNGKDCSGCFSCVTDVGQDCEMDFTNCEATDECPQVAACLSACGADGLCFDDCCGGHPPDSIDAAYALFDCQKDRCSSVDCFDFPEPKCSMPPSAP